MGEIKGNVGILIEGGEKWKRELDIKLFWVSDKGSDALMQHDIHLSNFVQENGEVETSSSLPHHHLQHFNAPCTFEDKSVDEPGIIK